VLTAEECAASGGDYLGDESSCLPNPCCPDPVQGSGPATAEVGNGIGRLALGEETRDCGQFVINADDSYENGYTWQYDAVVAPYYGAFAECYAFHGVICSVVTDLTQIGGQNCQVMDVYVWRDAAGVPGAVLYTRQVEPGPVAFWPEVSRHTFWVQYYESSDVAWAGFWGAWPGGPSGWFVAADTNGFGGCPSTNIAPGIGYPTGWNNVSIVWGPTQALGIGAEVMDGDPVPSIETSWGHIKSLFR
jgi:hypothetical protein